VNQFCSNKLIALDPSSTATGYALFEGTRIHEAGLLKPKKNYAAIDRIQEMAYDLQQLVEEFQPGAAVLEIPSKHVGKRHNGKGAGLAIYGVAVGYLLAVTTSLVDHVLPVDAQEWTASGKKSDRVAVVKSLYPQYDPDGDPGSDVADAVSLGLWYLNRERMQAAM